MEKRKVLTSLISTGTFNEFTNEIFRLTEEKQSSYVCFANVHMVIEAYKDKAFNKIVNEADIAAPDGAPLSKVMWLIDKFRQERVCGMDLLPVLLTEAAQRGKSVYFYGSTNEVLHAIRQRIQKELPTLQVAGMYSPPFRTLTEAEDQQIINTINDSQADLVFVALGCPKQEKWMAAHKGKVHACMLGVGQAFLVYAGLEKRLPKWARDLSLEWVYRLYLEPNRLWKRYLTTNSQFVYLCLKQKLGLTRFN